MSEIITLNRNFSSDKASYGMIHNNFYPIVLTLEPPWRHNEINKSCICIGLYEIQLVPDLIRIGKRFVLVKNVPHRTGIEIHAGTGPSDTRGCIIPGHEFDDMGKIKYDADRNYGSAHALDCLCEYIEQNKIRYLAVKNIVN